MVAAAEPLLPPQPVAVSPEQYHQVAIELQQDAKSALFKERTDWVMFLGTTNAIFVAWATSAYPEHMWLIWCIEALTLFALRLRRVITPTSMAFPGRPSQMMIRLFYMVEFCYYANYASLVLAMVLFANPAWISQAMARRLFAAAFGVSGSLLGATAAFRNRLLFHDIDNTVSVFIHFFPALVMYTITWHYDKLEAVWPSLFFRGPFNDLAPLEIWVQAAGFYMTWFVPYLIWMLCCGRHLPRNTAFDTCLRLNKDGTVPHDTIFHFNMRDSMFGDLVRMAFGYETERWQAKCAECDWSKADILVYMFFHACCNLFGALFSLILYSHRWIGGCMIGIVLILAVQAGSGRMAKMVLLSAEVVKLPARRRPEPTM